MNLRLFCFVLLDMQYHCRYRCGSVAVAATTAIPSFFLYGGHRLVLLLLVDVALSKNSDVGSVVVVDDDDGHDDFSLFLV